MAYELFGHMIDKREVLQFTSCKPDGSSPFGRRDAIADEEVSAVTFGVPITKQMVSRVVLSTNSGAPTKLLLATLSDAVANGEEEETSKKLQTSCTPLWLKAKYSTKRSNLKVLLGKNKMPPRSG